MINLRKISSIYDILTYIGTYDQRKHLILSFHTLKEIDLDILKINNDFIIANSNKKNKYEIKELQNQDFIKMKDTLNIKSEFENEIENIINSELNNNGMLDLISYDIQTKELKNKLDMLNSELELMIMETQNIKTNPKIKNEIFGDFNYVQTNNINNLENTHCLEIVKYHSQNLEEQFEIELDNSYDLDTIDLELKTNDSYINIDNYLEIQINDSYNLDSTPLKIELDNSYDSDTNDYYNKFLISHHDKYYCFNNRQKYISHHILETFKKNVLCHIVYFGT